MRRSVMFMIAPVMGMLACFPPLSPEAAEPIAQIKTVSGIGTVSRGAWTLEAEAGGALFEQDRLQTGADSSLGITFRDGSRISLGENSDFVVRQFVFEPQRGSLSFIVSLIRGALVYISGRIAALAPEAVRIRTVNGTVGVRGTRFAVRVPETTP